MKGIGYRASRREHTDLGGSAEASRRKPGRFNNERLGALYLSRDAPTALDEYRSTDDGHDSGDCVISVVHFRLLNVVDLTADAALSGWGLTMQDLLTEDVRRCQEVAALAADRGYEGIQWPSSKGPGASLAVFIDRLSPKSKVELVKVVEATRRRAG